MSSRTSPSALTAASADATPTAQPVETSITRVPQLRAPSGVWLDLGGMYSVAIHTEVSDGSSTAHE